MTKTWPKRASYAVGVGGVGLARQRLGQVRRREVVRGLVGGGEEGVDVGIRAVVGEAVRPAQAAEAAEEVLPGGSAGTGGGLPQEWDGPVATAHA